jgi:hypothetical protein
MKMRSLLPAPPPEGSAKSVYRTGMGAPPPLPPEDKKAALQEVLQTASFLRAEQLRNFLRFVCEMEIAGRAGEITEYLIGVEALGRAPGYSTAEDSIVRRRAIDLREKLDEVYTHELAGSRVRIELPKGRYVPHFVSLPSGTNGGGAVAAPAASVPPPRALPWKPFVLGMAAGALVASAAFLGLPRAVVTTAVPPPASEPGALYEAEASSNTLHGASTVGECAPCSGGLRVRNIGNSHSNSVVINGATVGADGTYTLKIEYFLQGSRSFFVTVNDGPATEVPLKGDSWMTPNSTTIPILLKAGANTIKFGNEHAYAPDLDRVVLR